VDWDRQTASSHLGRGTTGDSLNCRKDIDPAGAGETPIIAVAPAIANAVFDLTRKRVRSMPIRVPAG
jgi:hypothetical protein